MSDRLICDPCDTAGHCVQDGACLDAPTARCACRALNAYDCWTARYGIRGRSHIEMDGGPCECRCHDPVEYDDY